MNAPDRKIVNASKSTMAARFMSAAAAAALLSGCMSDPVASAKVDPASPISGEVAHLATANRDYPTFSEIPQTPTDHRPLKIFGKRAAELRQARAELEAATAPNTWQLGNTAGFAARAQAAAGPGLDAPTGANTEAFADTVRKRATPPPPAN